MTASLWLISCSGSPQARSVDNPIVVAEALSTKTPTNTTVTSNQATPIVSTQESAEDEFKIVETKITPVEKKSSPTAVIVPPDLKVFSPSQMKLGVSPVTYLENPCSYLENRWGEGKSKPGTIVVPIMFHSVVQPGRLINDTTSISMEYFEYFMETAQQLGFSTITTEELVGFLNQNDFVPERSMILILDDRRPGVTELFMPYLVENDWTLTLGWIAADSTRAAVWEKMLELAETGRLDVQSHGFNHIYVQDYLTYEQIEQELFKPIEVIQDRFGITPLAHVWPGGNFNQISIDIAYQAGYKIGFTAYSRGPIMFNWIPLGEPEIAMDAPLMLLPRFWSTAATRALEEGMMIGEEAKVYAETVKAAELDYYSNYCQSSESE